MKLLGLDSGEIRAARYLTRDVREKLQQRLDVMKYGRDNIEGCQQQPATALHRMAHPKAASGDSGVRGSW